MTLDIFIIIKVHHNFYGYFVFIYMIASHAVLIVNLSGFMT